MDKKTRISELNDMQHFVTQRQGTEPPFSGTLLHNKAEGVYHCIVCNAPLFLSDAKFATDCGWPGFFQPVNDRAIRYLADDSHGMQRTEIRCHQCDAHLGHLFPDGPPPTGQRYCVNSAALNFTGKQGAQTKG